MANTINLSESKDLLDYSIQKLGEESIRSELVELPEDIQVLARILFSSKTQSYREVLLGCAVVRYFDLNVELSLPYINLGENSYNGRTLDEKVINPFLHNNEIPASKGPYLATFRRSVTLDDSITNSQRDKISYKALLGFLNYLKGLTDIEDIELVILSLVKNFMILRDSSKIELARIKKLHLEQHKFVLEKLLDTPSGGLLPVLVSVALLKTIEKCYNLNWEIDWQGINQSDLASGAGGDITINKNGENLCVIEITERPIDKSRVVSTFNSKIVRKGITDYLFIYKNNSPSQETISVAGKYFAQGHEINFIQIHFWVYNNLATLGSKCRDVFLEELIDLLSKKDVPSVLKVKWNEIIRSLPF